jgi:hypothetical protein
MRSISSGELYETIYYRIVMFLNPFQVRAKILLNAKSKILLNSFVEAVTLAFFIILQLKLIVP